MTSIQTAIRIQKNDSVQGYTCIQKYSADPRLFPAVPKPVAKQNTFRTIIIQNDGSESEAHTTETSAENLVWTRPIQSPAE